TVTGRGGFVQNATVGPQSVDKLYLPWMPELKGPDATGSVAMPGTVLSANGAYHLVSSLPVVVYQFSVLEHKPSGGAPGKDWSSLTGASCNIMPGCFSFTNDASLLIPSTAMTGNYRVAGLPGWASAGVPAFFAVTATEDGTDLKIKVSPT